jgi:hypothetical protein
MGLLLFLLGGCGAGKPPPFRTWSEPAPPRQSALAKLGANAAAAAGGYAGRLRLSPTDEDRLEGLLSGSIDALPPALAAGSDYSPRKPFEADPVRTGWQLIGSALRRRLERQLLAHQEAAALGTYSIGLQFGMAIADGDSTDVTLGLPLVDSLRATVAARLLQLSSDGLARLARETALGLAAVPPATKLAENEKKLMLAEVQAVQDAYRDDKLDALEQTLRPFGHDALRSLTVLRERDDARREEYFQQLADSARSEAAWIESAGMLPTSKRAAEPTFKASARRPWLGLAKYLCAGGGSMLRQRDYTIARTRLLYLVALALKTLADTGSPPASLPATTPLLAEDPYCGETMRYVVRGRRFLLYSVGPDGLDNGGSTDAALREPDLFLEFNGP